MEENINIEEILIQLDQLSLPFDGYTFLNGSGQLEKIGSGGEGSVYRAFTRKKKKAGYAIKVIGFGNRHIDYNEFKDVLEKQRKISSLYIVEVYDYVQIRVWIEDGHTVTNAKIIYNDEESKNHSNDSIHLQFVVMEELENLTPQNSLYQKDNGLSEDEIYKLSIQIGEALLSIHNNNLMHLDIKIDNIFYSKKSKKYKLGDFGIAKVVDNGFVKVHLGTPGYLAPEVQNAHDDKYDYTADIYSFGMVLYNLLDNSRGRNIQNDSDKNIHDRPIKGSDEFWAVVSKMISYNPDDRYQTMPEVMDALYGVYHNSRIKSIKGLAKYYRILELVMIGSSCALIELSYAPNFINNLSWMLGVLWLLCLWKTIKKYMNKNETNVGILIFILFVYYVITTGFSWWKIVAYIFLWTDAVTIGLPIMIYIHVVMQLNGVMMMEQYRWIALLLVSLSIFVKMYEGCLLSYKSSSKSDMTNKQWFIALQFYWILIASIYYLVVYKCDEFMGLVPLYPFNTGKGMIGYDVVNTLINNNNKYIGIGGLLFCSMMIVKQVIQYCKRNRKK